MLFSDDEWLKQSATVIGKHIGVSRVSINHWRINFCREHGIEPPANITGSDGSMRALSPILSKGAPPIHKYGPRNQYQMKFEGKTHYLGHKEEDALGKREEILANAVEKVKGRVNLESWHILRSHLSSLQIASTGVPIGATWGMGHPRIIEGGIVIGFVFRCYDDVPTAVGRVLLNRAKYCPDGRAIILCYDPPKCMALDVAKAIGVEFLTPEQLAESLKRHPTRSNSK